MEGSMHQLSWLLCMARTPPRTVSAASRSSHARRDPGSAVCAHAPQLSGVNYMGQYFSRDCLACARGPGHSSCITNVCVCVRVCMCVCLHVSLFIDEQSHSTMHALRGWLTHGILPLLVPHIAARTGDRLERAAVGRPGANARPV
jgi:hypothetical protein